MRLIGLIFCFLFFLPWPSTAQSLQGLEGLWGLSSLNEKFQHPLEKLVVQNRKGKKRLEVSTWYEDSTVTKATPPDQELFCRFLHDFIYGRAKLRQKSTELAPTRAFAQIPNLDEIEFNYFAVQYRNQPSSPYWDKLPSEPALPLDKSAQLRVLWTREEIVTPYLSVVVSKSLWTEIEKFLKDRPFYGKSAFQQEACLAVYRMVPSVKSNFAELSRALGKQHPKQPQAIVSQ